MDDKDLIDHLLRDTLFRESIESEMGKLREIFADFDSNELVYVFRDGDMKASNLQNIITELRRVGYLNEIVN